MVCPSFWTEQKCCLISQLIEVKSYQNWVNMCNSWGYAQEFLTGDICIKLCNTGTYFQKRDCLDKCHSDSWQCYVTLLCILGWTTWICCRYNSIKCGFFFNWLAKDRAFYKTLMWASLLLGTHLCSLSCGDKGVIDATSDCHHWRSSLPPTWRLVCAPVLWIWVEI